LRMPGNFFASVRSSAFQRPSRPLASCRSRPCEPDQHPRGSTMLTEEARGVLDMPAV
jgi:hypothetical protein